MVDTALLFAAGRGKRMGALTDATPKPLLKLNDKALIDHAVEELHRGGVNHLHVNAAYLSAQIETHFAKTNVQVHHEPDGPYETGGTLRALADLLPDTVITLNSDVLFTGRSTVEALREAWRDDLDAILLLVPKSRAKGHSGAGDFFWDGRQLTRRGDASEAPYVYTGMQIIRPRRAIEFDEPVFSNNLIWDKLILERRIGAVVYDGFWMDIGTQEALESARAEFSGQ